MGSRASGPQALFLILPVASCAVRKPAGKSLRYSCSLHDNVKNHHRDRLIANCDPALDQRRQSNSSRSAFNATHEHPRGRPTTAMRSQLWLLAASGRVAWADWAFGQGLDHPRGEAALVMPRETRASTHDGANGWTPRPTDGPSIELARRKLKAKRQTANTCGWFVDFECESLCPVPEELLLNWTRQPSRFYAQPRKDARRTATMSSAAHPLGRRRTPFSQSASTIKPSRTERVIALVHNRVAGKSPTHI